MRHLMVSLHCVSADSLHKVRQELYDIGDFTEVYPGFWVGNCICELEHFANRLFSLVGWQDVLLVQTKQEEGQVVFFPK